MKNLTKNELKALAKVLRANGYAVSEDAVVTPTSDKKAKATKTAPAKDYGIAVLKNGVVVANCNTVKMAQFIINKGKKCLAIDAKAKNVAFFNDKELALDSSVKKDTVLTPTYAKSVKKADQVYTIKFVNPSLVYVKTKANANA